MAIIDRIHISGKTHNVFKKYSHILEVLNTWIYNVVYVCMYGYYLGKKLDHEDK